MSAGLGSGLVLANMVGGLAEHLVAAAFVAVLFTVQWLQFRLTSKPAAPADYRPGLIEVEMPHDLRRFFASGAF